MSTRDDVRSLEHEFAEAMQRLYSVGNGLARIRADLDRAERASAPHPAPVPAQQAVVTGAAPTPSPHVPVGAPVGAEVASPAPPAPSGAPSSPPPGETAHPSAPTREPWYRRESAVTRVLAVAGAVVTLAGVAMLLVIAVRQGWFGPVARVSAGAVLAAVLGGLGARQGSTALGRGREVGAAPVALVATGAATAYLDVVATTAGYGWLAPVPGLALSGAVALAGLWLARRWESELLAVLMVAGAAAFSPVVAGAAGWVLSGFLGVLALAGWWAGGERTRPVLTVVRSTPVAVSLVVGAATSSATAQLMGLLAVALVVLLATLATSAVSVHRHPTDVTASFALAAAVLGMLAVVASLDDPLRPTLLAITAAVLLLVATALGRPPVGPVATHLVVTAAVGGSTSAVLAVLTGAPRGYITTGLLLLAAGHLAAAVVSRSRVALGLATGTAAVGLFAWLQHPVAALTRSSALDHEMVPALVDSLLAVGVVVLAVWASASVRGVPGPARLGAVIVAWVVGLVACATALVATGVLVGTRFEDPALGFLVGQAAATVAWMSAAGWLLMRSLAQGRHAELALRGGLVLAAVAVAKLFLYDLAALSGLVRSVAFIATGLLLIATGSRYARAYERSRAAG